MFNKFEILGIALSVVVMATALYLIRLESIALLNPSTQVAQVSQPGLRVIDGTNGVMNDELADTLTAATRRGAITELVATDVRFGVGDPVVEGDTVVVNYIGTLQNGQEFDNSYKRGQPFTFTVGAGNVIAGWEEGIIGMKVGGQRVLVIPADKGYGQQGFGPIPGNATLVFSIELVEIR
jgi:peptidylprolyl isomerase